MSTRNTRGRQSLDPEGVRNLNLRVGITQRDTWHEAATSYGRPLSEWVRHVLDRAATAELRKVRNG